MKAMMWCLAIPLAIASCQDSRAPTAPDTRTSATRSKISFAGRYIIVFRADVRDVPELVKVLLAAHGGRHLATFEHTIRGYGVEGLPDAAAAAIGRHPQVAYVEPDGPIWEHATQSGATWGLDRIDQRDRPLSSTYQYNATGAGVNVYILDSGIDLNHEEFGGRAQYVAGGTNGDFLNDGHGSAADCTGHGTHVAATVGGAKFGVAKNVNLWAARVLDCAGEGNRMASVTALNWVTAYGSRPAVVNMSFGGPHFQTLYDAVAAAVAAGVHVVASAGNENINACSNTPANAPDAITVGATAQNDTEYSNSNYGTCVDILAPGVNILSALFNTTGGDSTRTGTSFAAPHVSGALALFLQESPGATPAQATSAIESNATPGRVALHSASQSSNTPNLLLYSANFGSGVPDPLPPADCVSGDHTEITPACPYPISAPAHAINQTMTYYINNLSGEEETYLTGFSCYGAVTDCSIDQYMVVVPAGEGTAVTVTFTTGAAGDGLIKLDAGSLYGWDSAETSTPVTVQ